jgi:hypothetical protein
VIIHGVGGLCVDRQGKIYILQIHQWNLDLLVLEIGTNDLANGAPTTDLSWIVSDICDEIFRSTSVKLIVLFQVVNRRRTGVYTDCSSLI